MIDYRAGVAQEDQLNADDSIELNDPDPNWPKYAKAETDAIKQYIDLPCEQIEHAGSTAIYDMKAKPVIDIFIALENIELADKWIAPLEAMGYVYWAENPDRTHRRFFKGMPPFGVARTHHLHILAVGEDFKRRIRFRDLLNNNTELRSQYCKLKTQLAEKYATDRERYTDEKGAFIKAVLVV